MNTVAAASSSRPVAPAVERAQVRAEPAPRSWLRRGAVERAGAAALAAGALWLAVAWALSAPGVA